MKNIFKFIALVVVFTLFSLNTKAQWKIDSELKDAGIKVDYSEANIDEGKVIYEKTCKACHKELSAAPKNDRAPGSPPNLGNIEFNKNSTDGEIFCKMTYGNGSTMPAYKDMLSDVDRWKLVAYIRSFYEDYEPPVADNAAPAAPVEKFEGELTNMELNFDKKSKDIVVSLKGKDKDGNEVVPKNVKVSVFVQRYFGQLPLCKDEKTDDKGQIVTNLGDVPTDTNGYVSLIAMANNGQISAEAKVQVNEGWKWVNPLDGEHLWGTRVHTPWWLMLLYFGITGGVLLTIAWAVFQLFRIYNLRER